MLDQKTPKGEGADAWHTDNTYLPEPPLGSILRAVQLPEIGGDTLWANMYAAYEAFSPTMQQLPRRAHRRARPHAHAHDRPQQQSGHRRHRRDAARSTRRSAIRSCAPIPKTGRKALFVSRNWVSRIEGLSERENEVLKPFLFDHQRDPMFQCRFSWQPGSVAFWDNRWAQHYAVPDYTGERRIMQRITIAGDPVV